MGISLAWLWAGLSSTLTTVKDTNHAHTDLLLDVTARAQTHRFNGFIHLTRDAARNCESGTIKGGGS